MWTIFKVLNLLQYCFCLLWFFGREACGILAAWPGIDWILPLCLRRRSPDLRATSESRAPSMDNNFIQMWSPIQVQRRDPTWVLEYICSVCTASQWGCTWHFRHDVSSFGETIHCGIFIITETPGVGDGQGSLACCSPWGCKESDATEWLNWLKKIKLFT